MSQCQRRNIDVGINSLARAFAFLLGWFFVVMSLNGCVSSHPPKGFALLESLETYQGTDWQDAVFVEQGNYRITTNTAKEVGVRAGLFMNRALDVYRQITGDDLAALPVMQVNVYATRRAYEREVKKQNLSQKVTTGYYSPEPPAAMHVPWVEIKGEHPLLTLAHEGFHQFAHQKALSNKQLNPNDDPVRFPVFLPLWLNEGLAMFVEGAIVTEDQFDAGRINPFRLYHLQKLIKEGRCPDLSGLLARRYGEPFTQADYSASWGVVFALYHGLAVSGEWSHGNMLPSFLDQLVQILELEQTVDMSGDEWVDILGRSSSREGSVLFTGQPLLSWEAAWKLAMLNLQVDVPSGGLNN